MDALINVQVVLRAGMESVTATKDPTGIAQVEGVLIVANTDQAAQKVLASVLADHAVTAVIIGRQPLSAILKFKPNMAVLGIRVAEQMLGKRQKAGLSIVPATALNALRIGIAGLTGLAGELLIVAELLRCAGLAVLNVNTVQVVLAILQNQNQSQNSH